MCAAVDCLALVLQQHHNLEGCSRSRADVDSVGKPRRPRAEARHFWCAVTPNALLPYLLNFQPKALFTSSPNCFSALVTFYDDQRHRRSRQTILSISLSRF